MALPARPVPLGVSVGVCRSASVCGYVDGASRAPLRAPVCLWVCVGAPCASEKRRLLETPRLQRGEMRRIYMKMSLGEAIVYKWRISEAPDERGMFAVSPTLQAWGF